MLSELYIRDFAIIDELRMQFDFGFNVLTGETGAGKSIILDSLSLILGGRADSSMVRAECDRAIIEAAFELTPRAQDALRPLLGEQGLEAEEEEDVLLLARELRANGRSICRVNGRTVTVSTLKEVGELLVDIHGQGEHLSLLQPRSHLPLLDSYGRLDEEREAVARQVGQLRTVQRELDGLRQSARNAAQRIDFLTFQVQEIDAAKLEVGEEEQLREERTRVANTEQLMKQAATAVFLLDGVDDETPSVSDLLGQVERAVSDLVELDPPQAAWLEQLQGVVFQFEELSRELRHYQDSLEFEPERLAYLEERLELINRLKRKYGTDVAGILATRDRLSSELENISHSEERTHELSREENRLLKQIGQIAAILSQKRQVAANELAGAIEKELEALRMPGARFAVDFQRQPDTTGAFVGEERLAFDQSGIDQCEFLISANPGEPLRPMARVASGGETARLMLALKTALAQVDATPTLIFDEIDQGIGGRVGDTVGQKLWRLAHAGGHQVIVVTHLPQLAGYGDAHFQVGKRVEAGRTHTVVRSLDVNGRVAELAAMLGTGEGDAQNGAQSILRQVAEVKENAGD
ncbi:MAG: DNA repair protein RecN [Anaerolineales bacterium]|nr:DNA repair protein RecN [Anaerolineales bacterium]MCB8951988.1 DNA repair protein RecN [Ardenticatenales bacterium]